MLDISYLTLNIRREKTTEGGFIFVARFPELEGAMAQGVTSEEAHANLIEVANGILENIRQNGLILARFYHPQPFKLVSGDSWYQWTETYA
jgi:predicted RNase H-like HicB family nuclease